MVLTLTSLLLLSVVDTATAQAAGTPTVTKVIPSSGGTAGGTVVTITGTNLTGATKVAFGGTAGTALSVVSATQVKVTAPVRAAGTVDVLVTTAGGTSAVATGAKFTYVATPAVTGISPSSSGTAGGTIVTITGTNMSGATTVTFGGTAGTALTVVSATQVKVTSPARVAGTVDVLVTSPGGASPVVAVDKYTYVAVPSVTALAPIRGPSAGGTVVTVTGVNLTGVSRVSFGTVAGTALTVVSATQVKVTAPAHAAGVVDVTVTTPGGSSPVVAVDKYTYGVVPSVTAVAPTGGPGAGGTVVTVTGVNFSGVSRVSFGTVAGTALTVVSATQVKVAAPAHAVGVVDVTVTTPAGASPVVAVDKYTYVAVPSVTALAPITGPSAGGTVVTVTGVNLTGVSKVSFGTVAGTALTVVSATQVKVTAPAHAVGVVDVTVTTPAGASPVVAVDKYTYVAVPSVTALAPITGPSAGGTVVTVTGVNLTGVSKVSFGTVAGTALTVVSATQVKVAAPAHAVGVVDVTVTTPGGVSPVVTADKYTYFTNPHVTGTISSSMTWRPSNSSVYILDGTVTILPGVTLTLAPGTVVKVSSQAGLQVQGSLVAAGTAASPVVLTSWRDDSAGGDTNGDGSASGPAPGDWAGISVFPAGNGSPNPNVSLDHIQLSYAVAGVSVSGAPTKITNSVFNQFSTGGIAVDSPTGVPTVSGNAVTRAGGPAIEISGASLNLSMLNGNSGSGNGLNGVQLLSDTVAVSSALPWTGTLIPVIFGGCAGFTVAAGVTLTLNPGTVIKGDASYCNAAGLQVQGSLVAAGTAASPVVLTSWRDDSVGGDTNGDGAASGPAPGDWAGISVFPAGNGSPNPNVSLDHIQLSYAVAGVSVSGAPTKITNSVFNQFSTGGIAVDSPTGVPTVSGNAVTRAGGPAIEISGASLNLSMLNGNSGSGNGLNGVQLLSDTVTVSSALPWTGTLIPVIFGGCAGFTVAGGVTLTLNPGTVIKGDDSYCNAAGLQVQGSLVAAGTAASPVVLTSWRDDSVGGDTNGDGAASGPAAGDWAGISVFPEGDGSFNPNVSLDHIQLSYASTGVSVSGAPTKITNSVFNQFSTGGIAVDSPTGVPTVSGNAVTRAGGPAIEISGASLNLSMLNGNSGSGNGLNGVQLLSDTVTVSSALPWTGTLIPVIFGGCAGFTVAGGVTLTLNPGTVIKGDDSYCNAAGLQVQGSLVAAGTAASPVVLTSWRDDSVGGDTNGDGAASGPAAGDWAGINVGSGGIATLKTVNIKYASTAVSASDDSGVEFHGSVVTSAFGVAAGDGYVDATNVDWGSASGPSPIGSGVGYSGDGVNVMPWLGYVAPTPLPGNPYRTPATNPCANIYFVAVRGSSETPQGDPASYGDPGSSDDGIGSRARDVLVGLQAEIQQYSPSTKIKTFGLHYRGLGVRFDPLTRGTQAYFTSIYEGVSQLEDLILDEERVCPTEKIVLSGYSQGALVIHIALRKLGATGSAALSAAHLAAVALIADPAKVASGAEYTLEDYDKEAGSGIKGAEGIWTEFPLNSDVGPLPSSVTGRTIAICRNHDPVCAPPSPQFLVAGLAYVHLHTDEYYENNTDVLGRWAADKILGRSFTLSGS